MLSTKAYSETKFDQTDQIDLLIGHIHILNILETFGSKWSVVSLSFSNYFIDLFLNIIKWLGKVDSEMHLLIFYIMHLKKCQYYL